MKLYSVFYLLKNKSDWNFYGAFTTREMAEDLEKHIQRSSSKPYKDIVETKIVIFREIEKES